MPLILAASRRGYARLWNAVTTERRQHRRLARPFEGSWEGASSGGHRCRIGDLSLGGCFVETLAGPSVGEETRVTVNFGPDISMSFSGAVVYVEPNMGFAVKFKELSEQDAELVNQLLQALNVRK
jgi:hypothetical protein